jgi:hypothetical protein
MFISIPKSMQILRSSFGLDLGPSDATRSAAAAATAADRTPMQN